MKKEILIFIIGLIVALVILFPWNFLSNIFNFGNFFGENAHVIVKEYRNCREKYMDLIDNLTEPFNGIIYDKRIAICLVENYTAYCLGSKEIKVMNYTVQYFESCYTQKSFNPEEYQVFILIPLKYLKENKSILELIREGKIKISNSLLKVITS